MSQRDRQLAVLMFVLGATVYLQVYDAQSILPEMGRNLGTDTTSTSLVVALTTAGMAISVLPWAYASDRLGILQILGFCMLAGTLLSVATVFVPGFSSLLIMRLLKGAFFGGVTGLAVAFIFERATSPYWATVIAGIYISGNTVGGVVTRFSTSLLAPFMGWRGSLAAIAALAVLLAGGFLVITWLRFSTHKSSSISLQKSPLLKVLVSHLLNTRVYWNYWQGFVTLGVFNALFTVLPFQIDTVFSSYSVVARSITLSLYALAFFSSQFSGRLAVIVGFNRVLILGYTLTVVGLCLLFIPAFIAYIFGVGLVVLGLFFVHPLNSAESVRRMPKARSQSTAIYQIFWLLGATLISVLVSWILELYQWSLVLVVLLLVVFSGVASAIADRSNRA